jgi:hypothetical protein
MWRVEYDPEQRLLCVQLARQVVPREMREVARVHALALEATGGAPYWVLLDLRGLYPLDGQAAEILADVKRVGASLAGYRGRAVLVDSATIAMQQRNQTMEDGGDASELLTWGPEEARGHVRRRVAAE